MDKDVEDLIRTLKSEKRGVDSLLYHDWLIICFDCPDSKEPPVFGSEKGNN